MTNIRTIAAKQPSGESVSEIQSLTARAQEMERSFNSWNSAYVWLVFAAVIVATAVFLAQFISIRKGRTLGQTQSALLTAKDSKLAIELKNKDSAIAAAQQKAGEANERAGLANHRAAALESANLRVRADLEHAITESRSKEIELETAQRKTAEAQEKEAATRLALAKYVDERTQPRGIPDSPVFLKPFRVSPPLKPLTLIILYQEGQTETYMFTEALWGELSMTNWVPERPVGLQNLPEQTGATVLVEIVVVTNGREQRFSEETRSEVALWQALSILNRPIHWLHDERLPDGTVKILIGPRL